MTPYQKTIRLVLTNAVVFTGILALIDPFFSHESNTWLARTIFLKEHVLEADHLLWPPSEYYLETEGLVPDSFQLKTDENGYILGSADLQKNQGVTDIIFFGGSTTECLFIDAEKRFPYLTGRQLAVKATGLNPRVLNAGVGANCSAHSSLSLFVKGLALKPEMVVFMHCINDLSLLLRTGSYYKGPANRAIYFEESRGPLSFKQRAGNFLRSTKDLIFPNIYWQLRRLVPQPASPEKAEWERYRGKIPPPDYETIEREFEASVLSFLRMARSHRIEVVLMTQFNRLHLDDNFVRSTYRGEISFEVYCSYYERLTDRLREIAAAEGVLLIDLAREVPADRTYMYDACHLNAYGSERVAEIIADRLAERYPHYLVPK